MDLIAKIEQRNNHRLDARRLNLQEKRIKIKRRDVPSAIDDVQTLLTIIKNIYKSRGGY